MFGLDSTTQQVSYVSKSESACLQSYELKMKNGTDLPENLVLDSKTGAISVTVGSLL